MKPNRIVISSSRRGTVAKATGHAAAVLVERLTAESDAHAQHELVGACTVHFEDHGQDFLEWDVSVGGTVTDCRPFQAEIWTGAVLLAKPVPGQQVRYRSPNDLKEHSIRYPVAKVVQVLVPPG